jgi:hypothetical protein
MIWCNTTCNTTVGPPYRLIDRKTTFVADQLGRARLTSPFSRTNSVFVSVHTIRGFGLSERFTRSFGEALDGRSGQDS